MVKNSYSDVAAVVLAAGKGTRLKSKPDSLNKVVMPLNGKPMIGYTHELLEKVGFGQEIFVVGYAKESIQSLFGDKVDYALQEEQLGTGHAAECGLTKLNPDIKYVLVLHGDDSAFYPPKVLEDLIEMCRNSNCAMSFLTVYKKDPFGIGRILRDEQGFPKEIVEEKNATPEQRNIKEVNLGMYCFKRSFIEKYIKEIDFNPVANERYLTDIVGIAYKHGFKIEAVSVNNEDYWHGVNTDEQWLLANQRMVER
ncbi:MAG: sugar phosphate nucleotidyltransferase [Patescibacteria group bacterium]|jgi:bifunctional UDP-N-acetylglucosamine pyrophosphorylase/glucosamine-1-phosphate N-acetyltransferase